MAIVAGDGGWVKECKDDHEGLVTFFIDADAGLLDEDKNITIACLGPIRRFNYDPVPGMGDKSTYSDKVTGTVLSLHVHKPSLHGAHKVCHIKYDT